MVNSEISFLRNIPNSRIILRKERDNNENLEDMNELEE
jgi:hypothetical protein